ncbi:hypothetical protein [Pseudomonas agarici]
MTIEQINIGAAPNDGNGQSLRSGGQIINDNFAELDTRTTSAQAKADQGVADAASAQAKADSAVPGSALGVSVAQLVGGVVPTNQLPIVAGDVFEFPALINFPAVGEAGKIYIAINGGDSPSNPTRQYRWSGTDYVMIPSSPSSTDQVAEGATNLYHTAARVRAVALTGLDASLNAAVVATDSILTGIGKLQKQISDAVVVLVGKFDKAGGKLTGALNSADIVTIASSATPAIGAAAANTITITGTTGITGFDSIGSGAVRTLIFSGVVTLTHNSVSLILPKGANITTAAGDVLKFVSLGGGNWKCCSTMLASGGGAAWGSISGTMSAQTDLQAVITGLDNRTTALESSIVFSYAYPNGGSAGAPANVAIGNRYTVPNPFPGHPVICQAEVLLAGNWEKTGWVHTGGAGAASTYGVSALHRILSASEEISVQVGTTGIIAHGGYTGGTYPSPGATVSTPTPCRVMIWRIKQ